MERQDEAIERSWWRDFAFGVFIGMFVLAILGIVFIALAARALQWDPDDAASAVSIAPDP